jgi:hypothetical protein
MSICCLARLSTQYQDVLKFPFGAEPIVQIVAWLLTAFEVDFICATSDLLVTQRVPY